jgi:hypothetical protein
MYVTDDLALPGECEGCHVYAVVRRFGLAGRILLQEAVGVVRYPSVDARSTQFRQTVISARLNPTPRGSAIGSLPQP